MLIIEDTRLCPIRIYVYSSYSKKNNFIGLYDKLKKSYSKMITDDELSYVIRQNRQNISPLSYHLLSDEYFNHTNILGYVLDSLKKSKTLCSFSVTLENDW